MVVIGRIGARYDQKPLGIGCAAAADTMVSFLLPRVTFRIWRERARRILPGYPDIFMILFHFVGARRNTGTRVREKEK